MAVGSAAVDKVYVLLVWSLLSDEFQNISTGQKTVKTSCTGGMVCGVYGKAVTSN